jgi:hypothetical protein
MLTLGGVVSDVVSLLTVTLTVASAALPGLALSVARATTVYDPLAGWLVQGTE